MNLSASKIAVTGASGFIGRYVVEALSAEGCSVVALTRNPAEFPPGIEIATTAYSRAALTESFAGVDAVVHLAGRRMTRSDDPTDLGPFLQPNVLLVGDALDAAIENGVRRFVFASTIAVYSPADPMPYRETGSRHPVNAYALSKKIAEDYMALRAGRDGMDAVALRFAATYGHGEKETPALMKFVAQALKKETLLLKGSLDHRIDEIYVHDVASAILATIRAEDASGAYNIGGGAGPTVEEIARTVNRVCGNEGNLDDFAATRSSTGPTYMDISKAREALGWTPAYSLEQGLMDLVAKRRAAQPSVSQANGED